MTDNANALHTVIFLSAFVIINVKESIIKKVAENCTAEIGNNSMNAGDKSNIPHQHTMYVRKV